MRKIIEVKVKNRHYYYSAMCNDKCLYCPVRFRCYTSDDDTIVIDLATMRKNRGWLNWQKFDMEGRNIK